MTENQLMTVGDLVLLTGMTKKEFADSAKMSTATLGRAISGQSISRTFAQRIVNALNIKLGTSYTIAQIKFTFSAESGE